VEKDGVLMGRFHEETPRAKHAGVPPDGVVAPPRAPLAPDQRTLRLSALEHLAAGLRATYRDTPIVTWQQIAHCTLSAAQHAHAASPQAGDTLQQRMVLNHDLDRAFMVRKNRQPWKTYDGPTLLLAADDLIAAERSSSLREAPSPQ
jgi:hypothetical protein